jgi:hypothetical protein
MKDAVLKDRGASEREHHALEGAIMELKTASHGMKGEIRGFQGICAVVDMVPKLLRTNLQESPSDAVASALLLHINKGLTIIRTYTQQSLTDTCAEDSPRSRDALFEITSEILACLASAVSGKKVRITATGIA